MGGATPAAAKKRSKLPTFVIQEHHARALHWDFRLERDGVLVSWALPKGLPMDPEDNHLAVHVEDHPLEYGKFEGVIPKGEYGAGHVTIWDHGTYETEKWRTNEVMVVLHGTRASGRYVLFPTGDKNWMIHRMDPAPKYFEDMPQHLKPMLAMAGDLPKSDAGWAYEFKWDGVRAMVYVDGGRVRAFTRNDKSLLSTFPELRDIGGHLGSRSAILDGEIVALDEEGRPNFSTLSKRLHVTSKSVIEKLRFSIPASFFAFDLLYLEGRSLAKLPYDERRAALESLKLTGETFATPPSITNTPGRKVIDIARERGLEGVVIKRRSSHYSPGTRNGDWIKVKNFRTQEVVIGGWTEGKGERARQPGRAAARYSLRRRAHLRRQSGNRLHRRDASGTPSQVDAARAQVDAVRGTAQSRRDDARALRSPDDRRRGPVRGVDERREPASTVVARTPFRQERERGGP